MKANDADYESGFNAGIEAAAHLFETQQQTFKTDSDEALLSFRVMDVLAENIRALIIQKEEKNDE